MIDKSKMLPETKEALMEMLAVYYSAMSARLFPFTDNSGCLPARTAVFRLRAGKSVMPFETARRFIDLLVSDARDFQSPGSAGLTVEFAGDEPFLAAALMQEITTYLLSQLEEKSHPLAGRLRLLVAVSGASYFAPETQAYIAEYNRLLTLCFTDGETSAAAAAHYERVYGGVKKTGVTITPESLKHTTKTIMGLIASGYMQIDARCDTGSPWDLDHAIAFYHQLKALADAIIDGGYYENVCVQLFEQDAGQPIQANESSGWGGGLAYTLTLDHRGDIYSCIRYMESALGTDMQPASVCSIRTEPTATYEQQKATDDMARTTRRAILEDICYECPIAMRCPNTSACNYRLTGCFNKRAANLCPMHKARVLACVYYFNKVFRLKGENKVFQNNVPEEWALAIVGREELDMLNALASPNAASN
jgi:uncharacterized protein